MSQAFARVCRRSIRSGTILLVVTCLMPNTAQAQLAGTFHSAPGTVATYQYQGNGIESVELSADITVTFEGNGPRQTLTATIHQPIIGDTLGNFNYPIVHEFPMVVTGTSNDGQTFHGDLLGTQYLFEWEFEPSASGELNWNGRVGWAGGRLEVSTIADARLLPGLAGDYNGNGTVDAADYTVWRDTLGQVGAGLAADGNASGTIDGGDFDVWRARFGQTAPSAAVAAARSTNAVPEPAAIVLMVAAAAGAALLHR